MYQFRNFLFVLFFTSQGVLAQQASLEELKKNRPEWKKDASEVAYVGARCAALDHLIGHYFSQEKNGAELITSGQKIIEAGKIFFNVSKKLSRATGMTNKFLTERLQYFSEWYSLKALENKKIHNDIFSGDLEIDFNFCVDNYQFYKALDENIKN